MKKKAKRKINKYFEKPMQAIANMMAFGDRQGRRRLERRLLGKGRKGWTDYLEAEKIIREEME